MSNQEIIKYIKNVCLILISILFLIYPLFFITTTTDFFTLPKQALVIVSTIVLMFLAAARMYFEKRITIKSNPFTIPLVLFGLIVLISAFLSRNIYDSLVQAVPLIFIIFLFFTVINVIEDKSSFILSLSSLVLGGVLTALVSALYHFKIYFLPFTSIQGTTFNTFGSTIQSVAYLIPLLILASFYILRKPNIRDFARNYNLVFQLLSSIVLVAGIVLFIYQITMLGQKPLLLPYTHGFQIALASISQDVQRLLLSFLFGSGYGTYSADFTRFKLSSFNQEQSLWNLTFPYSSSYFLELLSVTGILGALSFLFLLFRVIKTRLARLNPLFVALLVTFGMAFFVPFSYSLVFLLFMLLALYTVYLYLEKDRRVYYVTVSLVALREGLFSFDEINYPSTRAQRNEMPLLPLVLLALIILVSATVGYLLTRFLISDMKFTKSLAKENLTNGQNIYNLQNQAIQTFPWRSDYYRIFSQVNLALASSLITNASKQGGSPNAQTQKTVIGLLQQSINAGRIAVNISPLTAVNWESLSQIYRNLINVGQNAEQFAIGSLRQAIALDPSNPQLYIELGGIYYQLGNYELAQNAFQQAAALKPDFANAYYNLGHALESKGDLQGALTQYAVVRQLVANNKESVDKMTKEIDALQAKIGGQGKTAENKNLKPSENQPPLQVNNPTPAIPAQISPVKIPPPPSITPVPSKAATPTPTPTP